MALSSKIRELKEKREKLLLGGGEQAIEKQKALGKRTARERIMALLDEDSFNEYDLFVEHDARDFDRFCFCMAISRDSSHGPRRSRKHYLQEGDHVFR